MKNCTSFNAFVQLNTTKVYTVIVIHFINIKRAFRTVFIKLFGCVCVS